MRSAERRQVEELLGRARDRRRPAARAGRGRRAGARARRRARPRRPPGRDSRSRRRRPARAGRRRRSRRRAAPAAIASSTEIGQPLGRGSRARTPTRARAARARRRARRRSATRSSELDASSAARSGPSPTIASSKAPVTEALGACSSVRDVLRVLEPADEDEQRRALGRRRLRCAAHVDRVADHDRARRVARARRGAEPQLVLGDADRRASSAGASSGRRRGRPSRCARCTRRTPSRAR